VEIKCIEENNFKEKKMLKNRKGQGMVEYILIIVLAVIVVIAGVKIFGKNVSQMFSDANTTIQSEALTK
jgi:Flp pilus assembly pilin Flp